MHVAVSIIIFFYCYSISIMKISKIMDNLIKLILPI
nr:MAG TPA: hypothetical protein [Caudoviricetes sp.]